MPIYALRFGLFYFISAIFWLFLPNLANANVFQNQKFIQDKEFGLALTSMSPFYLATCSWSGLFIEKTVLLGLKKAS